MTPPTQPGGTVVCFGDLLMRLGVKGHARLVQAEEFAVQYTGAEANVAVSLAGFGLQASVVSRVPAHEIGQACVNCLRRYGVDTRHIVRAGERLGLFYLETGAGLRPSKVVYDRSGSSFGQSQPGDYDWEAILDGAGWFHFSGTAPALGASIAQVLRDAIAVAGRKGAPVSFDCNYRNKLWSIEQARAVLPALLAGANVFVGGVEDAVNLFGVPAAPDPEAVGQSLRAAYGLDCVAFSLRESESASASVYGAMLCCEEGCFHSRRREITDVVDRVGSGDSFSAGLIYAMMTGLDRQAAIEFAAAAACLKHTIPGDFNLVTADEVWSLVRGGGAGRVQR